MAERIFISGMGAVSPIGQTREDMTDSLIAGRNSISPLTLVDTSSYPSHLGAEVLGFSSEPWIPAMQSRKMDRVSIMAVVAAYKAIEDANLQDSVRENGRVGIVMGAGLGSTAFTDDFYVGMVKRGPASANPMLFPNTVPNAAASYISILLGFRGLNTTFCHKETSAEQALCYAFRRLRQGAADVILVGGAEEISPFLFHAYSVTKSLAPRDLALPEQLAPYDRNRNGLVVGEGAAILVLEREDHLRRRGGKAFAEILSAELASSPTGPVGYHPEGEDLQRALQKALNAASRKPADVDFISGGANSTTLLDRAESIALSRVLDRNGQTPPVTALKSYTGCFHACGALRLVLAFLAMEKGIIPRTVGLEEPLTASIKTSVDYVYETNRPFSGRTLMHCASSYGGTSSAILCTTRSD